MGAALLESTMTVIEVHCRDSEYAVESREDDRTRCGGPATATTAWFGRLDWQRGIDIVVIDANCQDQKASGRDV
jgi:hypothetical protein